MTETGSDTSKYTERQIALIKGEAEPVSNKEWEYLQEHGSDLLPEDDQKKTGPFSISGKDLDESFRNDRGNTQAGRIGEALDND